MTHEMRPVTVEEFKSYAQAAGKAFSERVGDEDVEAWKLTFEPERSLAVFDAGQIVGTAGAYTFQMTLPGMTTLPVAGVTAVGVVPTHRRRGILTEMMRRQLDDVRERGEPVAVLTASESVIYGRYGYGVATSSVTYEIDRSHAALLPHARTPGRVRFLTYEEEMRLLPPLYDAFRVTQPGALERSHARWETILRNPEKPQWGEGGRFGVGYEGPSGEIEGAAQYRVRYKYEQGFPMSTLVVRGIHTLTLEARVALWEFLLNVDLIHSVELAVGPVDEPLRWMLADPRRLRVTRVRDDLWVRLLDVAAALSARRYMTNGKIVLDVKDAFRPEASGRYMLEGGPEGAECRRTQAEADLHLGVVELGAAFLGGVRFSTLARAGRVEARSEGALALADAMFAAEPAPWCATHF